MLKKTLPNPDATKAAAQYLMRQGLASSAEIASASGCSRQLIWKWAKQLDAETIRNTQLARLWDRALRRAIE